MKHFEKGLLLAFALLSLTFFGCKKDSKMAVSVNKVKSGPVPSYPFNWETSTWMPSTPSNTIPMPWNSGTTPIDPDIANDYLSADGWSLVYNTFTPTTPTTGSAIPYFFALYNPYRGLIRFYVWQPPTTVNSSYVNHGLSLWTTSGTTSPMLNFEDPELADPGNNTVSFTKVAKQPLSSNGGTWFAFQYQIAYDSNVSSSSFNNLGINVNSQFVSVSQIKLDGTQVGTIGGTITSGGGDPSFSGTLEAVGKGALQAQGLSALSTIQNKTLIQNALVSVITQALQGNIGSVLNILLGGSTSSTKTVDLRLNSKIELAGTTVTSGGIMSIKLILPGQTDSQTANGLTPIYNDVMGVFNINAKPSVSYTALRYAIPISPSPPVFSKVIDRNTITFDPSPVSIVVNPAVSSVASVQLVKKELIYFPGLAEALDTNGATETIGNTRVIVNPTWTEDPFLPMVPGGSSVQPADNLKGKFGVRLTVEVTPTNANLSKTTIVKTFATNMVRTN